MKKDCEARLRDLVPADETIAAVGTAQELRSLRADIGSGGGVTFLVVTARRVLFAPWAPAKQPHEQIRFDEVSRWADGVQYNAYAVALTHPPMTRREQVPAHKVLWFQWGNAEADVTRTQTIFRFSRPTTEVAMAMRSLLQEQGVHHDLLSFEERSREDRMRGSHARLMSS
jgi:hypothetical protein